MKVVARVTRCYINVAALGILPASVSHEFNTLLVRKSCSTLKFCFLRVLQIYLDLDVIDIRCPGTCQVL
jgi:hypothetical protein